MTIFDGITLAGGLGLFLYGMTIMGSGLEKLAGGKLEMILRKVTSNVVLAVLFGAVLTAAIQSSSATTVIVVGLVNSGIMKLEQAIGIIMGANIGTTVTAQILRLSDISSNNFVLQLIKPTSLAPLFAIIGAVLFVFAKAIKKRNIGQIMLGFGILFTGMFAMEGAVAGLRESQVFYTLFATLENPILGVLAGAGVTALIQSSAASVGILQALSSTGMITWATAVPVILGQNIGTCVTPMISSIGASKGAKRSAFAHLYFNIIGTVLFLVAMYAIKAIFHITWWNDVISKGGIANFHTLFNIIVTVMFIPFTKTLARLAEYTIKDKDSDAEECLPEMPILDARLFVTPSVAIQQARSAINAMATNAKKNYEMVVPLLFDYSEEKLAKIHEIEHIIDRLEVSVGNYLVKISDHELGPNESHAVSEMLSLVTEFERIGDYAINISDRSGEIRDKNISFSEPGKDDLFVLDSAIKEIINLAIKSFDKGDLEAAERIEPLEETIDALCDIIRSKHISRLKSGRCAIESGIVYLEVLTNLERISDHCSNVAAIVISRDRNVQDFDVHELRRNLHDGYVKNYNDLLSHYKDFYIGKISHKKIKKYAH